MVQKFNKGDVVIAYRENTDLDKHPYFMDYGVTPTNQPLKVSDCDHTFVYFFGEGKESSKGWLSTRFKKVDDVHNVDVEEPDLYVYPDTPVGTVLVVTQDTTSRYGNTLNKGTLVNLRSSTYSKCGCYRHVMDGYGLFYWIDCDHLMIKG